MLYNSDKTNFHSFGITFSRSHVYLRQITTLEKAIYQKRSFWDASKFVFIIMLSNVKDVTKKQAFYL